MPRRKLIKSGRPEWDPSLPQHTALPHGWHKLRLKKRDIDGGGDGEGGGVPSGGAGSHLPTPPWGTVAVFKTFEKKMTVILLHISLGAIPESTHPRRQLPF